MTIRIIKLGVLLLLFSLGFALNPHNSFAANVVQPNTNFIDIFNKILMKEIIPKNKNITISTQGFQFSGEVVGISGSLVELKTGIGQTQIISFSDIQAIGGEFGQ